MTYGTTFSGIGGWEIGLDACGWQLLWQCECEPFCQALLRERFGVPIYGDIRTLAEANPPKVDALIGSPPCLPFSHAGARLGLSDERHLYPSFLSTVGRIRPRWVLMEQVAGLLSANNGNAFGVYIGGLAALRYDLVWHCIPACAVGADHERDRVWIIAYDNDRLGLRQKQEVRTGRHASDDGRKNDAHAYRWRGPQGDHPVQEGQVSRRETISHSKGYRCGAQWPEWERQLRRFGIGRASVTRESDEERNIESPLVRRLHGIPNRVDRIKSLGNAVVPSIPYLIGRAINCIEGMN